MKSNREQKEKILPFTIFWIMDLSYTSTYILRLNLSVAKPSLEEIGKLDVAQLAFLGSVFSLVYAVGKLVNGGLGDRIQSWVMVTSGLILAGISNIVMGFLLPYGAMAICWGLNAFAQSMLWGCILRIVAAIYDERTAQKKATMMATSIAIGNVMGILLASYLLNACGTKFVFLIPGILTVLFGIAVIFSCRRVVCVTSKNCSATSTIMQQRDTNDDITCYDTGHHER